MGYEKKTLWFADEGLRAFWTFWTFAKASVANNSPSRRVRPALGIRAAGGTRVARWCTVGGASRHLGPSGEYLRPEARRRPYTAAAALPRASRCNGTDMVPEVLGGRI